MNYKKFTEIKEIFNSFDDTEFESLISESSALIKNENGKKYSVPFEYNENGNTVIFAEKAKLVEKPDIQKTYIPTVKDIITEKVHNIRDSIKRFFEAEEDDSSDLEEISENLDYIKLAREDQMNIMLNEDIEDSDLFIESEEFKNLDEQEKEIVADFRKKFSEQQNKYNFFKNAFMENGKLFEFNKTVKKDSFLNPLKVAELYKTKNEIRKSLESDYSFIESFHEEMESAVSELNDNQKTILFKNIDFMNEADFKTGIAKNLVILKKNYNEQIDINTISKKINAIYNESFKNYKFKSEESSELKNYEEMISTLNTDSNGTVPSFKFLKFKMNVFSPSDLLALRDEFNNVIKNCYSFSQDALTQISLMRDKIDYMIKTGNTDDEMVGEIINSFNKNFGEYENTEADFGYGNYNDEDEEETDEDYDSDDEYCYDDDDCETDYYDYDDMDDEEDDEYEESLYSESNILKSAIERAKEKVKNRKE